MHKQDTTINNWFAKMPSQFKSKNINKSGIIFQFNILQDDNQDISKAIKKSIHISQSSCLISDDELKNADVYFSINDRSLIDIIYGEVSFYDAFLSSRLIIQGKMKYASEFMEYFPLCMFPNREIKLLTIENVFDKMNNMIEKIPEKLINKNIQIKVTGKNNSNYFFKIDDSSIQNVSFDELKNVIHAKMTIPENILIKMFYDEIEMMEAYEDGQLAFTGENQIGIEFDRMFNFRFKRYKNA